MKGINLVGKRFGKLTVLETLTEKENKTNRCYCICKCDCGKITKQEENKSYQDILKVVVVYKKILQEKNLLHINYQEQEYIEFGGI